MPYRVDHPWQKNPRLVGVTFYDDVLTRDIVLAFGAVCLLLDQALLPLHSIIDFTAARSLPNDLIPLMLESEFVHHPQRGWCVFVDPDAFVEGAAYALRQEAGLSVELVASQEEAWEFFNQMGIC